MKSSLCGTIICQVVAIIDLAIAATVTGVATSQFSKGTGLISGQYSYTEKVVRVILYGGMIYLFLLVQLFMAIRLYRSAIQMRVNPEVAIKNFGWWREWSVVCLMILLVHAMVVLMVMDDGQRKILCLVTSLTHAILRPIGITIIGNYKHSLESDYFSNIPK